MKKISWISVCGLLAAVCVQTSFSFGGRCECNQRARFCLPDPWGLRCVDCQGNTEGRHCERCKDGFYLQGAGPSCSPCLCNPTGSVSAACDSRGRCSCRDNVSGDKCERCPDGPIGPNGCPHRRQEREDSGSLTLPCFCYGHSHRCSAQSGYSVHNITSTFTAGPEGWKVATEGGVTPHDVYFRWSPKHQDLEVISKHSLPTYLYAPEPYLGNQLLSYGQNLSFSLRLDRGVRHPSTNDVILEGAGLRVSASLGDLRATVPCGQKINYSFRLDEQSDRKWRPQLSSDQFQKLLQNLTAIKVRATFGENGRGYLDNVKLVSARRGDGVPARWVQTCSCPRGHEGQFCEVCSAGFRRRVPADGAFSPCEPCSCRGGSCDPQTGDCYSADETPEEQSCSEGFYRDRRGGCVRCPCPQGTSCSLAAGSLEPQCESCPPATLGPYCDVCQEGFYGDPTGFSGLRRPCRPCSCNGHIDVRVAESCDRRTGDCLKCLNNTRGQSCESCLTGFYHSRPTDACKPCSCDLRGSESAQCNDSGQCRCRPDFEGLRCQRSRCPACFNPVKAKMELSENKLKDLDKLLSEMDSGLKPVSSSEMEVVLKAAEETVRGLQDRSKDLTGMEKVLQSRLSSISRSQLMEGQEIQNMAEAADSIREQQQIFQNKVAEVQTLIDEMRRQLEEAKTKLNAMELPLRDAPPSWDMSSLVKTATTLSDEHKLEADDVQQAANEALSDSKESLALVRALTSRENKVQELIGDLNALYDQISGQVKSLEKQAVEKSGEAKNESKMADGMLEDIAKLEQKLPPSLKEDVDAMASRLDGLKKEVQKNISALEELQGVVQQDQSAAQDLLDQGRAAQQDFNKLLDRVNAAKTETEDALKSFNKNNKELDDALQALRGFDQQIDDSKASADAAIKRLPGINATVQQAVSNNAETRSVLDNAAEKYNSALGTIGSLENLVNNLEGLLVSLPPHAGLVDQATTLNKGAQDLKTRTVGTAGDLGFRLEQAQQLEKDAAQTAAGAAAASDRATRTRDAVRQTLQDINKLLANTDQTEVLDQQKLKQLEDSLDKAQKEVDKNLRPRLRDMEDQEAAQRRQLTRINLDIDTILADIANLEDILRTVPNGCFNSPPIEEA
ncbi:laminin subunit gamma-2 isoform X2 [Austrofundulus limnaeus]|uniref:Laminin subunit gamma-2 isoform X2 n=1 Tax=Austrofundulus limnaeus TaxID=52670 RepID=A0A2I4CSD4_AUSLI|nr:PREDICTED: laminin subunit gamma-2-like isoform X2 [Austrofundulus limnaeus]